MPGMQVIVIGGGAAGFFAAVNCAQLHPGCRVVLLEKTNKLLSKVRISGGGRCNLTHACFDNSLLVKNYPRGEKELKSLFSRFSVADTTKWFEERGVRLKTEPDGRMFPVSDSSETIVNCLLSEAEKSGISLKTDIAISSIRKNEAGHFEIQSENGGIFFCEKLIVATGGSTKMSSYQWIKNFGHSIVEPVPSLFTFNMPGNPITKLMGISVPDVKVKIAGTKIETEGALLITHWGMSGPAVLKASAWGARLLYHMNYDFIAVVNWIPGFSAELLHLKFASLKKNNAGKLVQKERSLGIPNRLWEYLSAKSGIPADLRWADTSAKQVQALAKTLLSDEYEVQGKTTFKEEFVTCGGISLKEINFTTMESKIVPGLFFAGEVLDIDAVTGGFNFQNAWSTAWVAARHVI